MNFTHGRQLEYILVENFYDQKELNLIWKEIEFLKPKLLPPDKTNSAMRGDGTSKKNNEGIFLDDVYANRDVSDILQLNRKLWANEILNYAENISPWWRLLRISNHDNTLLNYYENSGYYEPHTDKAVISAVTVLYKEPCNFTGGELVFPEYNVTINCKSNTLVIFPSVVEHGVKPVKLVKDNIENSGRFSIAQFVWLT